jgi:hypothetical protein
VLPAAAPPGIGGVGVGTASCGSSGYRGVGVGAARGLSSQYWGGWIGSPLPLILGLGGRGGKAAGLAATQAGPWPCGLWARQKPGSLAVGRLRGSEQIFLFFYFFKRKETL